MDQVRRRELSITDEENDNAKNYDEKYNAEEQCPLQIKNYDFWSLFYLWPLTEMVFLDQTTLEECGDKAMTWSRT